MLAGTHLASLALEESSVEFLATVFGNATLHALLDRLASDDARGVRQALEEAVTLIAAGRRHEVLRRPREGSS